LVDLFSLCNILELANVTHHATYNPGGLKAPERQQIIFGRAKSREVVTWVLRNYELQGDISLQDFFWRYLAYQAHAICYAKETAESEQVYSYTGRRFSNDVSLLIQRSFVDVVEFWPQWESFRASPPHTFAWPKEVREVILVDQPDHGLYLYYFKFHVWLTPCFFLVNLSWRLDGRTYDDVCWAGGSPATHLPSPGKRKRQK
jgi:hypothetical protein